MQQCVRQLARLAALILGGATVVQGQSPTTISGVVRDRHGVPQMGAAVELLSLGQSAVATTFTDLQGRYLFHVMLPGTYQVQATATLFLPATRRQLRVTPGAKPRVDLTLIGLFDESRWLPVDPPAADERADDWKWTLRSPSNRPMLRVVSDGIALSGEGAKQTERHGQVGMQAGTGHFGSSSRQLTATAGRSTDGGRNRSLAGATLGVAPGAEQPAVFFASTESTGVLGSRRRMTGAVRSMPQMSAGSGSNSGVLALSLASGEQLTLGDLAQLECGSQMQAVRAGSTVLVQRPFLRVNSAGLGQWELGYALATSPEIGRYEELGAVADVVPTVATVGSRLLTDTGIHQQVRLRRSFGRGHLEVSYHHDLQHRAVVSGAIASSGAAELQPFGEGPLRASGIMYDQQAGLFRALASGFRSDGYGVEVGLPFGSAMSVTGALFTGNGLALDSATRDGRLAVRRSQAVLLSAQGRVGHSGPRVTAAYRWQPATMVTVVAPYDLAAISPYLSLHMRQKLTGSADGGAGVELTVDGTNLLKQGYQPAAGAGADAVLASALRELRAGISFNF